MYHQDDEEGQGTTWRFVSENSRKTYWISLQGCQFLSWDIGVWKVYIPWSWHEEAEDLVWLHRQRQAQCNFRFSNRARSCQHSISTLNQNLKSKPKLHIPRSQTRISLGARTKWRARNPSERLWHVKHHRVPTSRVTRHPSLFCSRSPKGRQVQQQSRHMVHRHHRLPSPHRYSPLCKHQYEWPV